MCYFFHNMMLPVYHIYDVVARFWLQTSCFIALLYVPVASFPMYVRIHVSLFCSVEEVAGSRANAAEEVDVAGGWLRRPFFARMKARSPVNIRHAPYMSYFCILSLYILCGEPCNSVCSVLLHFDASYCALMLPKLQIYYGQNGYLHDLSLNDHVQIFCYSHFLKSMLPLCRLH